MTPTLFLTDEEHARCRHDPALIAQKADAFIRELYNQVEIAKSQYDASSITAEQTCSLLEQRYISLKSEFDTLQSQHSELNSALEGRVSELDRIQAEMHRIHLQSIGNDGEMERLSHEASELQKSKRQLVELVEHKDLEINEKDASIKGYLDKIVTLTNSASLKDSRISELDAELARSRAHCARLSQEKEIVERHNVWLDDELTAKINSLLELRKVQSELEADSSFKLADFKRKYEESYNMLSWKDDRVKELESKLKLLQEEFCSSKDAASATEEGLSAELLTVNKLVELYKESSEEWSKKAGELEGVIKAMEIHENQVEEDYKQRVEKETSVRIAREKEVSNLKEKLEKFEVELEGSRKSDRLDYMQMGNEMDGHNLMLVPSIPAGISGTALAASLLRDGWNLVKMYEKYQEAMDALRHEQLGRKESQSILERVLHEIEEKTELVLDERAEHDRMVEAYDTLNERLQHSLGEQSALERTIREMKAELKTRERDYALAQKENNDLRKEVTILLKECRDIQIRCGSLRPSDEGTRSPADQLNVNSDAEHVIPEELLTFKDINGLVEQNVQFRSLVRHLSEQIETREVELKENFQRELERHSHNAFSKVEAVLARAEEQAGMIESLHTSVSMYKKLYEEEHKRHLSNPQIQETELVEEQKDVLLLLEGPHDERVKLLEEEIGALRGEILTLRSQCDKLTLEANFAQEKLDRFAKEFQRQRDETNGAIAQNTELSQSIVNYQQKLLEASETSLVADDMSRKLNMEVSVLRREKELVSNSEKKAWEEVSSLSERVHRLQASLDTIRNSEEAQEEARRAQRKSEEDYVKRMERERAEAKKELQEERDNVRKLKVEHDISMKGARERIEGMGFELTNALRALADANAKADVLEARFSESEKIRLSGIKNLEMNDGIVADLRAAKEEIERLREDAKVNKEHLLQYKNIANVNESALKQIEVLHENLKVEAEKVKKSLEDEVVSLKERANKLQDDYTSKAKEAASATLVQDEALASLREECTAKTLNINALEARISAMKDDLEKERQRWRTAQGNYERQVMLQSETIQELTKTSKALASLQEEASELRRVSDCFRIENAELRGKWETEKLVLEEAKDRAVKKYNEIYERNKILLSQLEAFHIKLGDKDADFGPQSLDLHRTKETAETEISLLKQEKLRLQAQLEGALMAEAAAQETLRVEHEDSRSLHFTVNEFKALQLQVGEMNLLRESNIQLREENQHNFEECQKLRLSTQNARNEVENLQRLLGEKRNEVDACRREMEVQKKAREDLEKRVGDLLLISKNVNSEDYDRMRADIQQMTVKMTEKDKELEGFRKAVFEKQEVIIRLERDLARSRVQADERESKISSVLQAETSLKSEVDRQKRIIVQFKRRCEELSKKNQELSTEAVESSRGRKNTVESKEREEKDTRIQMLEKTVDKLRDEVKKGKDEVRFEKAKNLESEKGVSKLADDLEKHKQALKTVFNQVEKLKQVTEPEGSSTAPPLSGYSLDELTAACLLAIENFEQATEMAAPMAAPTAAVPAAQNTVESRKALASPKPKGETRKAGRRLVRPNIVKPDQPKRDVEPSIRKRSSTSEGEEGLLESGGSDAAPPVLKKSRGSGDQKVVLSEALEGLPSQIGEGIENLNGESVDLGRDEEAETGEDQEEDLQNDKNDETGPGNGLDETDFSEDQPKASLVIPEAANEPESVSEPIEKELATLTSLDGDGAGATIIISHETGAAHPAGPLLRSPSPSPSPSPMPIDDEATGDMEVSSPLAPEEHEGDREAEVTAPEGSTDEPGAGMAEETLSGQTSNACVTANASVEGSSVSDTNSRTVNLNERARQRPIQRVAGARSSPVTRSRGGTSRGRGRGGRTPGPQGM